VLRLMIVLLAALVAAPAASAASAARADRQLNSGLERLLRQQGGPPGAIAMVYREGRIGIHTIGKADLATGRRWRQFDHMRIASVSKAFSGAVTLSLVRSGKLRLNSTIGKVLPGQPASWGPITLRQLLGHRSGLPDYSGSQAFLDVWTANPKRHFTPQKLLDYAADERLRFPPGARYEYSNTDNIVAALMAEAVTGKSYETLLARRVFRPLVMPKTSLPSGAELPDPFTHGYAPDPPGPLEDVSETFGMSALWASGGIVSTPADLGRFIRAYVSARLFGSKVRAQQRRFGAGGSEPTGPGRNSAGLALFRYQLPCGTVYGHTGNFFGYTQFAAANSDGTRSATVAINQQITPTVGDPGAWKRLRTVFRLASCAALAGRR
jgi:D-alanyl-D-alanine carboxypeptidase